MTQVLTLDGLALPLDLLWVDEYDWTPIEQTETWSVDGTLVIETSAKIAGRPITLAGDRESGWATKTQVDALFAKLTDTSTMTLVMPNGDTFNVKFRHKEKPIEVQPILHWRIMGADDPHSLIIKLLTV